MKTPPLAIGAVALAVVAVTATAIPPVHAALDPCEQPAVTACHLPAPHLADDGDQAVEQEGAEPTASASNSGGLSAVASMKFSVTADLTTAPAEATSPS